MNIKYWNQQLITLWNSRRYLQFRKLRRLSMNQNVLYDIESQTRDSRAVSTNSLLADISKKIFDKTALPQFLEQICEEACHALGADQAVAVKVALDEFTRQKSSKAIEPPWNLKKRWRTLPIFPKFWRSYSERVSPKLPTPLLTPSPPPSGWKHIFSGLLSGTPDLIC